MSDTLLVYVVKHALTEGIRLVEAVKRDGKVYWQDRSQWHPLSSAEYTLTESAAIQRAEAMRRSRINALQCEIRRLARVDIKRRLNKKEVA